MGWFGGKKTVEDCLKLDGYSLLSETKPYNSYTVSWSRGGVKHSSIGFWRHENKVVLTFTHNKTEDIRQEIDLTRTPQPYGGYRQWFLCPYCRRRVAKLYGGKYFACRHCHNLTYESCNESHKFDSLFRHIGARVGTDAATVREILDEGREMRKIERRHRRLEYMKAWREKRKRGK